MDDEPKQDVDAPARSEVQQNRAALRVALGAAAIVVLVGAGLGIGLAVAGSEEGSSDTALSYAQKACEHVNMGSPGESADSADSASDQAEWWSDSADNAARAARLDEAWNELVRATDAQYRAWNLAAQGADQTLIDAAIAETRAHPFEPECRKALVR
ncbi:hypothetical protein [Streptomyces ossamyceticus]|uniref:hypothetical protein n=1 Tax=Streptomyces ossamyceticus TaxID=249581 RepID=UPI0012FF5273|nr:hypothetical protein [Streptomyces ossamyceticus]